MANTKAKTKSKRKAVSQRGIPNKKKKTIVEENSVKDRLNNENDDNFLQIKDKFEEELKCNICTEIFIKPTVLNCSHMFCEYCITKWKKQQERCPICRERIELQIRVLALDVFIEKVLEVLTPEEINARGAIISQREKKNDLEEREEDSDEEEAEDDTFMEDSTYMEDNSDENSFSSDEDSFSFDSSLSDSNSDSSGDFSDETNSLSDTSSYEDPEWDPDVFSDECSDVG